MKKKFLSFILALAILFSLGATTFASDSQELACYTNAEVIESANFSITIPNSIDNKSTGNKSSISSTTSSAITIRSVAASNVLNLQYQLCKNTTTCEIWAEYTWL